MRLEDVVGQDAARTALLRAVAGNHLAHAYLFEGPAGVGKRGAAHGLAMALDCPVEPGAGCGACEVCRRIDADLHPDVPTFGPSGPGNQIVMEDAKAILALVRMRPHEAPARVIIVDDADALNPNAANCLLKTLEEPLPGNHIVLCSSAPERLLPTIRSRTQRVRFRPLDAGTLVRLARARGFADDKAEIAAALADGSAARLWSALDEGASQAAGEALGELRAAITGRAVSPVFDVASALTSDRDKTGKADLPRLLALLARLYRDALAIAAGAPELAVLAAAADARGLAALGVDPLSRGLAAIVDAETALGSNVNPTLAIERLLLTLRRHEARAA
jgi:DNA polymerase III subunit delta'